MNGDTMVQSLDVVIQLFEERGGSQYGREPVTQLEHALQAAYLAEQANADGFLIAAALLHDAGHLLHDLDDDAPARGIDDVHEALAAQWLKRLFDERVLAPIRMHVDAKRYLCAVDPEYLAELSEPSKQSLMLQGGPMSGEERSVFENADYADAAIQLRRWDDAAKIPGLPTPPLRHYLGALQASRID